MKILTIDVGNKMGWCFYDATGTEIGMYKLTTLGAFETFVKEKIDLYKPDVIASARPTMYPQVIAKQSKLLAIIELRAEKRNIPFMELIDCTCKKVVIGKGNAKKPEIVAWAKGVTDEDLSEDEADAVMFAYYVKEYLK